jgi:hypothetical protein
MRYEQATIVECALTINHHTYRQVTCLVLVVVNSYSQELAFVAAVLLLQLEEEGTFWVLAWLAKKYSLAGKSLFGQDLLMLRQSLAAFDTLLAQKLPGLHAHLVACGVESSMYVSHWLCTLFVYNFPIDLVFRVWDVLFLESWDHIFKIAIMFAAEGTTKLQRLTDITEN